MEIILLKSRRMALVSAWFCWLCGVVFLAFGLIESIRGRGLFPMFLILCGFIFVAIGFAYAKSSKRSR
jgi:cytochrome bd-type quinol oxidase subunit 2